MNKPEGIINDADPSAISIEEARRRIISKLIRCVEQENISVAAALGRINAETIESPMQVPPFRASAMDGYAIRSCDWDKPLRVAGQSLAGHPGQDALTPLSAQRITTGARVPNDADAVVQQENVTLTGSKIVINKKPEPQLHIRQPGSDSDIGCALLQKGAYIGSVESALLAAHGITQVNVIRKLKVAVFSTGDELVEPGNARRHAQIYDANRTLLSSMLNARHLEIIDLGIARDTENDLQRVIDLSRNADVVVSSGGVSVGDADYVKKVLQANGTLDIWKIAMKPGRPLTFGFLKPDQAFFGLPGNPVSAAVTCLMFVRPALDALVGVKPEALPALKLPLIGHMAKNPGRVEYQRAIMQGNDNGQWSVSTTGLQDSHVLTSLHKANCLVELSAESMGASDGDLVNVYPYSNFARSRI